MKVRILRRDGLARVRRRLATTAAAVLAAALLPLAAVLPAAADDGAVGTAVQTGSVPTLVNGSTKPAELHFEANLPADTTGEVSVWLYMDGRQFPPGQYEPWRLAASLGTSQCSSNKGPYVPCTWHNPGPGTPESGDIHLYLPRVQAAPKLYFDVRVTVASNFIPTDQDLTGQLQLSGSDSGASLAVAPFTMHYHRAPTVFETTAVYAVDKSGVLWQYLGTNSVVAPFKPRVRIGGGWQVYDLITKVNETTADGTGDLVARDKSGVLWYYQGTGTTAKPFFPRVRVGGGWGQYTAITAGGYTGGYKFLVARDRAGNLFSYAETGDLPRPFAPRLLVGYGWNIYDKVTGYSTGVIGRDPAGGLWVYDAHTHSGNALYGPRVKFGHGWQIYNLITSPGDVDGDFVHLDMIARDSAGKLWLHSGVDPNSYAPRALVGGGWQIYTTII